jgi:hypothetical protein
MNMRSVVVALGVGAVVVSGAGVTVAATGKAALLAQKNTEKRTTTISNTGKGAALSLKTKSSKTAPLSVSNSTQIPKLNASEVGGKTVAQIEAHSQSTFSRIVVVHPGSTNQASGTALRKAIAGITPDPDHKVILVYLEPGAYDVGDQPLDIPQGIDLEGSGVPLSVIQFGSTTSATTTGLGLGGFVDVENLEVDALADPSSGSAVAVRATALLGFTMENVLVSADAHDADAIDDPDAQLQLQHVTLAAGGEESGVGDAVEMGGAAGRITLTDSYLDASSVAILSTGDVNIIDSEVRGQVFGATNEVKCFGDYNDDYTGLSATCT